MTTIAWTGLEVAADTRCTAGDLILQSPTEKLTKHKGVIYCLAGNFAQAQAVVDWLKRGADPSEEPTFTDPEFGVLVIKDYVTGYIFVNELLSAPAGPPITMGTGDAIAMGAILAGASAEKAVEIACKLDPNSGPPVQVMKVCRAK